MTNQSVTTWEGFAEATLTRQDRAAPVGRELAAQTPPVRLARRARHRKPVRRRGVITRGIFLSFSLAAALACTFGHPQASAPAFGGIAASIVTGPASHASPLPPCRTEDSSGCYWNPKTMGNHRGHFTKNSSEGEQ